MSSSSLKIEKFSKNQDFWLFFQYLEASKQINLAFILLILGFLTSVPCPLKDP